MQNTCPINFDKQQIIKFLDETSDYDKKEITFQKEFDTKIYNIITQSKIGEIGKEFIEL
ncbi:MAG: hypothetical protein H0V82_08200 [Candidatus Protochlamydia sp.]|nr:hypothetical protein [Candidatus Protochlamydia sp.]